MDADLDLSPMILTEFNLDLSVLHLNRSVYWKAGVTTYQPPKTKSGRRSIALTPSVGILLLNLLNYIRLISLIVTHLIYPQLFVVMHLLVWQPLVILAAISLWLLWIRRYARPSQA